MTDDIVLVIGCRSFLAREFVQHNADLPLRLVGHEAVIDDALLEDVGCVVNFAFHPDLHGVAYDPRLDIDTRVARAAANHALHYVMLSSRRVYQVDAQWNAKESMLATGADAYGRNKLRIERELSTLLGARLTVLRPGNVIGFERLAGRARFGAYLLNQLADSGLIRLTVSPKVRRDVVPVDFFCSVLREMVLRRPSGIFNVGTGNAVPIGRVADWIIEGYGSGRMTTASDEIIDEFQLDCTKLASAFGLSCEIGKLAAFTLS